MSVGHSHYHLACNIHSALLLTLLLEQTESQGSLGGRATLADIDDSELAVLEVLSEFIQVVLADVVACEEDIRVLTLVDQPLETVAQSLDDSTCTQIRTSDTCYYHSVAVLTQCVGT